MRRPPRRTVCAAVVVKNGMVLLARRKSGDEEGDKWEFPGGTVEEGETPAEALRRELKEELGVEAERTEGFLEVELERNDGERMRFLFFRVNLDGRPVPLYHQEIRWVPIALLDEYEMPPADVPAARRLMEETAGPRRAE